MAIAARAITFGNIVIVSLCSAIPLVISARAEQTRNAAAEALRAPQLRSIEIVDQQFGEPGSPLTKGYVKRLVASPEVESAEAFGAVNDVRPADGWPLSTRIPMVDNLLLTDTADAACGTVRLPLTDDRTWHPTLHLSNQLTFMAVVGYRDGNTLRGPPEQVAVRTVCDWRQARTLQVLIHDAADIDVFLQIIRSVDGPEPRLTYAVPQDLGELKAQLTFELGTAAVAMRLSALAGGTLLVAITMLVAVRGDARHIARRRALGATRGDIVTLVLAQTAFAVIVGLVVCNVVIALAGIADVTTFDPAEVFAVDLLMSEASLAAVLPVALWAAWRDPATTLRVP